MYAPPSGREVAGRFTHEIRDTTPQQIHRQIAEYRKKYRDKAIIHGNPQTRQHAWAALTSGASLLVGQLPYADKQDPSEYLSPELCSEIQPTYDFIRNHLSKKLPQMSPHDELIKPNNSVWCLANPSSDYLVYAHRGGNFEVDLTEATGSFSAQWFDPRSGKLKDILRKNIRGGESVKFMAPDHQDWGLWISQVFNE